MRRHREWSSDWLAGDGLDGRDHAGDDIVGELRTKRAKGELPFSSPKVKNALDVLATIWKNDAYVYGGSAAVVTTFFGDAPTPMFEQPPKCWLHKQGNFITSFFPEGSVAGTDYDVFYLPPIDDAYGKPFLVAGDIST